MSKLPKEYLKHILDETNYLIKSSKDLETEIPRLNKKIKTILKT